MLLLQGKIEAAQIWAAFFLLEILLRSPAEKDMTFLLEKS